MTDGPDLHADPELDDHLAAIDAGHSLDAAVEVDTLERANRVAWRIGQLRRQLDDTRALHRTQRRRLDEWYEAEQERIARQVDYLEDLAGIFHRRLLASDSRRKTVNLPAGTLRARKKPDEWVVQDDAALIAWAEEHGHEEMVRRPDPQVDRKALRKTLRPVDAEAPAGESVTVAVPGEGTVCPHVTVVVGAVGYTVDTPDEEGDR